jgi:hypothetical protein
MDNGTLCEPSAGTFHLYEPVAAGIAAAITFHDGTVSRVALKPDVYSILTLATFRECQWISAGTPAGNQLERLLNEVTPI